MTGRDSSTTSQDSGASANQSVLLSQAGAPTMPLRWGWIIVWQTLATLALAGLAIALGSLGDSPLITATQATSFALACGVVWLFCVGSTLALALVYPLGVNAIMIAWFGGLALRMVGSLAGGWALVWMELVQPRPMALGLGVTYMTLLMIEAGMLGRAMFQMTSPVNSSANSPVMLMGKDDAARHRMI